MFHVQHKTNKTNGEKNFTWQLAQKLRITLMYYDIYLYELSISGIYLFYVRKTRWFSTNDWQCRGSAVLGYIIREDRAMCRNRFFVIYVHIKYKIVFNQFHTFIKPYIKSTYSFLLLWPVATLFIF